MLQAAFYKVIIGKALGPYWDTLRLNRGLHKIQCQKVTSLSPVIQIFMPEVFYFVSRLAP
jgi:hypothetical protein